MASIRLDPTKSIWSIVSEERQARPDDFEVDESNSLYEEDTNDCPFCEGNEERTPSEVYAIRTKGEKDQPGWSIRVIPNKYPALSPDGTNSVIEDDIYTFVDGFGYHELLIETPEHHSELRKLSVSQINKVLQVYQHRMKELGTQEGIEHVNVFKNYGPEAGASRSHPHSQIIATPFTPSLLQREYRCAKQYYSRTERCLYCDIIDFEREIRDRILSLGEHFLVYAPYAPRVPFELHIIPREHSSRFQQLPEGRLRALAGALKTTLESLFQALGNPSYNYYIHTSFGNKDRGAFYHWHIELLPRLSKLAGFEWGTGDSIITVDPKTTVETLPTHQPANDQ
mgnify:CR=1 FL=1